MAGLLLWFTLLLSIFKRHKQDKTIQLETTSKIGHQGKTKGFLKKQCKLIGHSGRVQIHRGITVPGALVQSVALSLVINHGCVLK